MGSSPEIPTILQAWRLVPEARSAQAWAGDGARLYGGRWNSPGRVAVYAGGSRALAALELLVHLPYGQWRFRFVRYPVRFRREWVDELSAKDIPADFGQNIAVGPETQTLGDSWLEHGTRPVLRVPSVIIPEESNYLINPRHRDFHKLEIGGPEFFAFDPRLLAL